MRNALHIIIGFIVWNYIATVTNLAWGNFDLGKGFIVALISGVVGAVCGLCQEWLQEMISAKAFSWLDVKLTAIGFVAGGLLAYAFCVPSWLFCLAIGVVIIDWLRNIFKWEF
jgi:hypothetical protein